MSDPLTDWRLFYLATPYNRYPDGLDAAWRAACEQVAVLMSVGVSVFSPIAHSHGVALHGNIPATKHTIWLPVDMPFMHAAYGLICCKLPSWEQSVGMRQERKYFERAGKPVIDMEPGIVPEQFAP